MGGTAAGTAAGNPGTLPLAAYVGLHGAPLPGVDASIRVPTMHTTGGADKVVLPAIVKAAYEASVNAHPRVLAELANATHFEPAAPATCQNCSG